MAEKRLTKVEEKANDKGRKKRKNESFGNTTILRFLQPRPPKTMEIAPSKKVLSKDRTMTKLDEPMTQLDRWWNCFKIENFSLIFADLLTVERSKARYEHGEIAHIENVMATERRERKHTDTRSTETYFLEEVETIREEERKLETTDRFELEKETERATQEELSFQAGVSVSVN